MRPIVVLILDTRACGTLGSSLAELERARTVTGDQHEARFRDVGMADVRRVFGEVGDGRPFGARLREHVAEIVAAGNGRQTGLIVLGAGSMPLARREDYEVFAVAANGGTRRALANSYYSADALAVPDARFLLEVSDLPSDNALPRWLAERAGVSVADLRDRPRLAMDIDSPLDAVIAALDRGCPPELARVAGEIAKDSPAVVAALAGIRRTLDDRRAEFLLAGRTSSRAIGWLEQRAACRVRSLVEERGLRAGSPLALGPADADTAPPGESERIREPSIVRIRRPRSILGMLLDDRGPAALGAILGELGDAAVIDTRVLLAHRLGADERSWPRIEDRMASDLLRPGEIADPWLRDLTNAAAAAPMPILLGGHSLVGPGIPLLSAKPR